MNKREKIAHDKYESLGYDVIKSGIPDLVLLKDGIIKFIEIKSPVNNLSENQERAFDLLKKHGFSVKTEIVELEPPTRRPIDSKPFTETLTEEERVMFDRYIALDYPDRSEYSCFADFVERNAHA